MDNRQARELARRFVNHYRRKLASAFLFGSTARGRPYPRDVDILIIKRDRAKLDFRGFPELNRINYIVYSESYAKEMLEKKVGDYKFYEAVLRDGERLL